MEFNKLSPEGLVIITHRHWEDERGYFTETYNRAKFLENGIPDVFVQDNLSCSHRGVLRGLHAQAGPQAQGKLVRVVRGRVWDVAVDIRTGSPSYGRYFSIELSGDDARSLWIPPGFLHGFLSLEDDTLFAYKVSGLYDPAGEFGIRWDDPAIGIDWPRLPDRGHTISEKDQQLPLLTDVKSPFVY